MVYNLTAIAVNSSDTLSFIQGVDTVLMGGFLGLMYLMGFGVVMFGSFLLSTGNGAKALIGSSFITLIVAFIFRAMSLVNDLTIFVMIVLTAGIVAFSWGKTA